MPINDPRDIPGLLFWGSAEHEAENYTDGQSMTGWTDLSGNGNHAIAQGGLPPQWEATTGAGGVPAMRFRGTHGVTSSTWGYFALPASIMGAAASGEMLTQVKSDGVDCSSWSFGITTGSSAASHYPFSNVIYESFGSNGRRTAGSPVLPITVWRRYNVWAATNDMGIRLDETIQYSNVSNTMLWDAAPTIGHGKRDGGLSTNVGSFKGRMSAFILYSRKLTTLERADLTAWLAANPGGGTVPPEPPTDLSQVSATPDSVLVDWVAPVGGTTAPDSYEYRVDNGFPIDVGLITEANIIGLAPATSYDVEVRSVATSGESAWVGPLTITTEAEPPPPPPPPAPAVQCFAPIRGSAIRVTALDHRGLVYDPVPYAVSKSVARIQIREVLDSGNNEVIKNPEEKRRLRFIRPARLIRNVVDIDFIQCEPSLLSLVSGAYLVGTGAGFGEGGFGEMPFGLSEGLNAGIDVGTHREPVSFGLEVWSKLAGQRCADGTPMWGYTVFQHLRGGRITGIQFANGLVSFRVVGAQARRTGRWGVGPHDLTGVFQRLISPVSRNTGWRMQLSEAAPPSVTDGILYASDVLDNGTAADPMPDPDAPLVVDAGGAETEAWIIDGGRA